MTVPRGVRNNNPTNIEWSATNQWQGLDDPPSDGRFCRFVAPQWGLRATLMILRKYQSRGAVTLLDMIGRWAPATENDVLAYTARVVSDTGIEADAPVDLADKGVAIALLKAMVAVECGPAPAGTANGGWLDDAVYEAAWSLARPLTQSRTMRGAAGAGATIAAAVVEVASQHAGEIGEAGTIAAGLWPRLAPYVMGGVALCFVAWIAWTRWQAREEGAR